MKKEAVTGIGKAGNLRVGCISGGSSSRETISAVSSVGSVLVGADKDMEKQQPVGKEKIYRLGQCSFGAMDLGSVAANTSFNSTLAAGQFSVGVIGCGAKFVEGAVSSTASVGKVEVGHVQDASSFSLISTEESEKRVEGAQEVGEVAVGEIVGQGSGPIAGSANVGKIMVGPILSSDMFSGFLDSSGSVNIGQVSIGSLTVVENGLRHNENNLTFNSTNPLTCKFIMLRGETYTHLFTKYPGTLKIGYSFVLQDLGLEPTEENIHIFTRKWEYLVAKFRKSETENTDWKYRDAMRAVLSPCPQKDTSQADVRRSMKRRLFASPTIFFGSAKKPKVDTEAANQTRSGILRDLMRIQENFEECERTYKKEFDSKLQMLVKDWAN